MKYFHKLLVLLMIYGISFVVNAGCEHEGVTYGEGATICSGGWLMQCTAAGYWGTIGSCHHEDQKDLLSPAVGAIDTEAGAAQIPASIGIPGMTGNFRITKRDLRVTLIN